jgi:hypothetical protein
LFFIGLVFLLAVMPLKEGLVNKCLKLAVLTIIIYLTISSVYLLARYAFFTSYPKFFMYEGRFFNNFTIGEGLVEEAVVLNSYLSKNGHIFFQHPRICRFITARQCFSSPSYFDVDVIEKLNSSPEGSILMLFKADQDLLKQLFAQVSKVEAYDYADRVLIKLPLQLKSREVSKDGVDG